MGLTDDSLINRPILASIHTEAFRHNLNRVRELAPESKICLLSRLDLMAMVLKQL